MTVMNVARNKKQYECDKFEDCLTDDTKAETKPALNNLHKDERNPKNEESTIVNDNIQQSRKSSQNRQELQNSTYNSMTEKTEDNSKKWNVHYENIKDKLNTSSEEDTSETDTNKSDDIKDERSISESDIEDDIADEPDTSKSDIEDEPDTSESEIEDEPDTSESDDIEDEVNRGNNENYKSENSIGTKVNSISNKTEPDRSNCGTFADLHNICSKIISFIPKDHIDLFEIKNLLYHKLTVTLINQRKKEEENMIYKPILSQHYNSSLAFLEGNKFKDSIESVNFRTIFVDNLPVEVEEEIIRELFEPYGHIEQIQIHTLKKYYGKKVNRAKRRKLTKVASITFSTISAAQKAVSKNPLWLNNYYVNIQFFDDAHINIETFMINRIFLLNVPHNVTKETLCEFFDDCGEPLYIRYLHEAITEEFTGIVYVQFQTPEAVKLALQKNYQYLSGKCLTIVQNLTLPENINLSQLFYTSFQGLKAAIKKNSKKINA